MLGGKAMQIQSSYIFLPNPYNKKPARWKDEKGVIHIETGRSVYSYIRKAFPDARCDRLDDGLFQQSFSITVEINESPVEISMVCVSFASTLTVCGTESMM